MSHTIQSALKEGYLQLLENNISNPSFEARILLQAATKHSLETIIGYPEQEIAQRLYEDYIELIKQRCLKRPTSQIVGYKEFWGNEFYVNEHTLTPRPDSETLIEAILKLFPNKEDRLSILDLGTGTGCLILSLLKEYKNMAGIAVDISESAIKVAQKNAEKLEVSSQINFVLSNWADGIQGKFDIIISNPPYIPREDISHLSKEVRYDPELALVGGADGLDCYRNIVPQAYQLLKDNGVLLLEFGIHQENDIADLLIQNKYTNINEYRDLAGIIRCMSARRYG